MAKGPIITDEIKRIIAGVYDAHRDWRAKQVQFAVNERLHGSGPGLSAVQKVLTEIRKRDEYRTPELKGLDEPWSLASSSINPNYELPPEAIPIVLEAKRIRNLYIKRQLRGELTSEHITKIRHMAEKRGTPAAQMLIEQLEEPILPLSVREAQWIARIYYVFKDKVISEEIAVWAGYYAGYEKECELAGITCNTSDTDNGLLWGDIRLYSLWRLMRHIPDKQREKVEDIERNIFGHILEGMELSPMGWTLYRLWLELIIGKTRGKWLKLSTKELEDVAKRLRDWVLEQEPVEEFSHPKELLKELFFEDREVNQNSSMTNGGTS